MTALAGAPDLSTSATQASPVGGYTDCLRARKLEREQLHVHVRQRHAHRRFVQRGDSARRTRPANASTNPARLRLHIADLTNTSGTDVSFSGLCGPASPPGENQQLFVVERGGRIAVITNFHRGESQRLPRHLQQGGHGERRRIARHGVSSGLRDERLFLRVLLRKTNGQTGFPQRHGHHRALSDRIAGRQHRVLLDGVDSGSIRWTSATITTRATCTSGRMVISTFRWGMKAEMERQPVLRHGLFSERAVHQQGPFATILRIDVDKRPGNSPNLPHSAVPTNAVGAFYSIPADNPFIGRTNFNGVAISSNSVRTEMYCIGLRNPWRFSFGRRDRPAHCGDVGWVNREEIDIIQPGITAGRSAKRAIGRPAKSPNRHRASRTRRLNTCIRHKAAHLWDEHGNTVMGGVVSRHAPRATRWLLHLLRLLTTAARSRSCLQIRRHEHFRLPAFDDGSQIVAFGIDPGNGDVLLADNGDSVIRRLSMTPTP